MTIMLFFSISMIFSNQGFENPAVEIKDWKVSPDIQAYGPENLYEYINGAADAYLTYDFVQLKVMEYTRGDASVTLEIYKHSTPDNTFGIYSQERPQKGNFIQFGAQGYHEDIVLNFFGDCFYIKLNGYKLGDQKKEILYAFAQKMEQKLKISRKLPSILKFFPADHQIENSTHYLARDFLGYSFLHSAFTSEYRHNKTDYKMFVITTGDKNESLTMLSKYAKAVKSKIKPDREGFYSFSDPYNGPLLLYWKGRYICGILKLKDFELMRNLIQPLINNI